MSGFKTFVDEVPLFASEINGYLMGQTVMRFPTTALLLSALTGNAEVGQLAWADNTAVLYQWDGTNWLPLASPEKSFTPTWSGPTALTIGNGTLTCRWRYTGGKVFAHYELVRGSTTNVGTSSYTFTLPIAAASANHAIGQGVYRDASPFTEYPVVVIPTTSTTVALLLTASNTRASNAAPVTPATSDSYLFDVMYEPGGGIL